MVSGRIGLLRSTSALPAVSAKASSPRRMTAVTMPARLPLSTQPFIHLRTRSSRCAESPTCSGATSGSVSMAILLGEPLD